MIPRRIAISISYWVGVALLTFITIRSFLVGDFAIRMTDIDGYGGTFAEVGLGTSRGGLIFLRYLGSMSRPGVGEVPQGPFPRPPGTHWWIWRRLPVQEPLPSPHGLPWVGIEWDALSFGHQGQVDTV